MEVQVPQEVSVTGFDNLDISEMAYVPLTTVSQDMEKTVPVELIARESCGRCEAS